MSGYEKIRRALAKGPTPGEWYWSDAYPTQDGRKTWSLIGDGGFGILSCDGEENSPQSVNAAAAELIAACDPDTIAALLKERDALRDALSEALTRIAAIGYPANPDGEYSADGEWTFSDAVPRAVDAEAVKAAFLVIRAALAAQHQVLRPVGVEQGQSRRKGAGEKELREDGE